MSYNILKSDPKVDNFLSNYFNQSSKVIKTVSTNIEKIKSMAFGIYESQLVGGKLLVGGNGGSSADAQHFAGEMTCTYSFRDRKPFSAISLTENGSAITAWANDFDFESYFCRQIEALGAPNDILFLISTGGGDKEKVYSMNLVKAAEKALEMDMKIYSIVGKTGGELHNISHESIKVSSHITSHIQEAHITIIHSICEILDYIDQSSKNI